MKVIKGIFKVIVAIVLIGVVLFGALIVINYVTAPKVTRFDGIEINAHDGLVFKTATYRNFEEGAGNLIINTLTGNLERNY